MLADLLKIHKKFPKYLLEIMSKDYEIPSNELENLIKIAIKSRKLIKKNNIDTYYEYGGK